MPQKRPCHRCAGHTEVRALVDSEDRIWQRWRYCPACGYDQRKDYIGNVNMSHLEPGVVAPAEKVS